MSKKNRKEKTAETAPVVSVKAPQRRFWAQSKWHVWLLFLIGFGLYLNTFGHDYAQDDAIVIKENTFTKQGLEGLGSIFSYNTFRGYYQSACKAKLVAGGRYRPLSVATFAIEYAFFGENPLVSHIINALLYALIGVLIYQLVHRLAQTRLDTEGGYFFAFTTALLFLAHPIHTEAVANIKGRDEILALLGSLAALYFSLKAHWSSQSRYAVYALLCFFAALLSKENAITFLAIVPLTFYFFEQVSLKTALQKSLGWVVVAGVWVALRQFVIATETADCPDNTGVLADLMNDPFQVWTNGGYVALTALERLPTVLYSLGKYLILLVWPHPLTSDYYPRQIPLMGWGDWGVWVSVVAYAILAFFAIKNFKKRDITSFGILFFLITLSPVSNLFFSIGTNMGERFVFMPSLGICLLLAALFYAWGWRSGLAARPTSIGLVVLALWSFKTIDRNADWKNDDVLVAADAENAPNSAKGRLNMGALYNKKAIEAVDAAARQSYAATAVGHLNQALSIHPLYRDAALELGTAYYYLSNFDSAVISLNRALTLDPNNERVRTNLSVVYRDGGKYYGQVQQNLAKSIEWLKKATDFNPADANAWSFLGTAYGLSGQTAASAQALEKALALRYDANDWQNIMAAYQLLNRADKLAEWAAKKR